ncbi:hypothetical protein BD779DRAFT_1386508, partial [Infundibulicybe gibba]
RQWCDVSCAKMVVPAGQTQLVVPEHAPSFVTIGVGVQNYTCDAATSTYKSIGAVAEMYDISCLLEHDLFDTIEEISYGLWFGANENITTADVGYTLGAVRPPVIGQHFFVKSDAPAGISPKWEFTLKGGEKRSVVVTGAGSVPSPHGKQNIPWLSLRGIEGDLAKQVFRTDTVGGVPPASCAAGSPPISVRYTSKY